jgi:acylpyruvate hydrolase
MASKPAILRARMAPMRLATIRAGGTTSAVRLEGDEAVQLDAPDVGAVLHWDDWRDRAAAGGGRHMPVEDLDYAPLVMRPDKIVCVGVNYRKHMEEMGREPPAYPTLFAKYRSALTGAHDELILPAVSSNVDWEAELAVIVGSSVRNATPAEAADAIAGYSVINDVTLRDWQNRTLQWLQGKSFEGLSPLGPALVTTDEPGVADGVFDLSCTVDGEQMQHASTSDLVFGPVDLVAYISTIVTLEPGDVIATGTPEGVGHARKPPRYLSDGSELVTTIAGIGECRNRCRAEKS